MRLYHVAGAETFRYEIINWRRKNLLKSTLIICNNHIGFQIESNAIFCAIIGFLNCYLCILYGYIKYINIFYAFICGYSDSLMMKNVMLER